VAESTDTVDGDAHTEIKELVVYADAQERKVSQLQTTVSQLQSALDSRVVIERATGMLAERFDLPIPDAFELLRSAARSSRRKVSDLAQELTESRGWTPDEIVIARRGRDGDA
jgi:AmiR/NasT family two-component response regulator